MKRAGEKGYILFVEGKQLNFGKSFLYFRRLRYIERKLLAKRSELDLKSNLSRVFRKLLKSKVCEGDVIGSWSINWFKLPAVRHQARPQNGLNKRKVRDGRKRGAGGRTSHLIWWSFHILIDFEKMSSRRLASATTCYCRCICKRLGPGVDTVSGQNK